MARDAALDRLRRTRRWVILATAGLTAGFAALVSAVAPGRSLASKHSAETASSGAAPSARSGGSSIPRMPPPANAGALGLQSPAETPSPVPDEPQPQSDPSAPSQPAPSQPAPSQPQPQSAPAPAPAPPVVSGGS
jgi:hypothetical protein